MILNGIKNSEDKEKEELIKLLENCVEILVTFGNGSIISNDELLKWNSETALSLRILHSHFIGANGQTWSKWYIKIPPSCNLDLQTVFQCIRLSLNKEVKKKITFY